MLAPDSLSLSLSQSLDEGSTEERKEEKDSLLVKDL